jgi:hypothetical protein
MIWTRDDRGSCQGQGRVRSGRFLTYFRVELRGFPAGEDVAVQEKGEPQGLGLHTRTMAQH